MRVWARSNNKSQKKDIIFFFQSVNKWSFVQKRLLMLMWSSCERIACKNATLCKSVTSCNNVLSIKSDTYPFFYISNFFFLMFKKKFYIVKTNLRKKKLFKTNWKTHYTKFFVQISFGYKTSTTLYLLLNNFNNFLITSNKFKHKISIKFLNSL